MIEKHLIVTALKRKNQLQRLGNSIDYTKNTKTQTQSVTIHSSSMFSFVAGAAAAQESGEQLCLTTKNWNIFCHFYVILLCGYVITRHVFLGAAILVLHLITIDCFFHLLLNLSNYGQIIWNE